MDPPAGLGSESEVSSRFQDGDVTPGHGRDNSVPRAGSPASEPRRPARDNSANTDPDIAIAQFFQKFTRMLDDAILAHGLRPRGKEDEVAPSQALWKIQETGCFWPDAPERYGTDSIFVDKNQVCYRDAALWIARVDEMARRNPARDAILKRDMPLLLRGSALMWYEQQLSVTEKAALRLSVDAWTARIKSEFGIRFHEADQWLRNNRYTAEDNLNDISVRKFAMDLFRYSRVWGESTDRQLATRLYGALHPELRQLLPEPTEGVVLGEFVAAVDAKQRIVREKLKEAKQSTQIYHAHEYEDENEDTYWSKPGDQRYNSDRGRARGNSNFRNTRHWSPRPDDRHDDRRDDRRDYYREYRRDDRDDRGGYRRFRGATRSGRGFRSMNNRNRDKVDDRHNDRRVIWDDRPRRFIRRRRFERRRPNRDGSHSYFGEQWVNGDDEDATAQCEFLEKAGYVMTEDYDSSASEDDYESEDQYDKTTESYHMALKPGYQGRPVQTCTKCYTSFGTRKELLDHCS